MRGKSLDIFYSALVEQIRSDVGNGRTSLDTWADKQFEQYGETMSISDLANALDMSVQAVRIGIKNKDLPGTVLGDGERAKYVIHTAMFVSWIFNFGHESRFDYTKQNKNTKSA